MEIDKQLTIIKQYLERIKPTKHKSKILSTLALSGTETGYQGIHTRWTHCPNSNKAATEVRILTVVQLKFTSDTKMSRAIGRGRLTTLKISFSFKLF